MIDSLVSQFNGVPEQDPMFSKRRMQETLTYGYFELLGTMSKRREGLEYVPRYVILLLIDLCLAQTAGEVQAVHRVLPPK